MTTLAVEPEGAQKWEQPSPTEYLFHLQPNVKFHNKPPANGRLMTADDVVFSLNRGLWLSLGIGIVYAAIRFGLRGDFKLAGKVVAVLMVIGAVLVHGARAPHVITRQQLGLMKRHAVLVDVSIDQGGCFETSRPTTHSNPTYEVDGIIHYCVTNMPGAVPVTSTYALTNATMPYVIHVANAGVHAAVNESPGLKLGVNVAAGQVTYAPVADAVGARYVPVDEALANVPATVG